jgi:predicted PurR-regulated permease PerM
MQNELVHAALVVVATLVGLQLLWSARFLILTVFLAILFGLAASRAVDAIASKLPIRRSLLAPLVVFSAVAALALIGTWAGPTLMEQSRELRSKLPEAVGNVEDWLEVKQPAMLDMIAPRDTAAADSVAAPATDPFVEPAAGVESETTSRSSGGRLFGAIKQRMQGLGSLAFGVLQSTFAVGAGLVLIIFLALYIAMDPGVYKRGLLLLLPLSRRPRIEYLLGELGSTLRTWFATQLIAMVVIGAITTTALALIGVRAAVPLGVIAGLFEFVPNIGPVLSAIPAVLMGFVDSPQTALTVAAVYWAIQFLENNLLIPYLMREQLDLPPALTLVTQVLMAYVFGFLGLFVAIPMLATAVVTVRVLWIGEEEYARSGEEPPAVVPPLDVLPVAPPETGPAR